MGRSRSTNGNTYCSEWKNKSLLFHLKNIGYLNFIDTNIKYEGLFSIYLTLTKLGLEKKYERIQTGDKIRYFSVKTPNRYGIKKLAFKYYYPDEFKDLFQLDHKEMFDNIVYSVIKRFYENVKWTPRKPGELVQCDLFDLLS